MKVGKLLRIVALATILSLLVVAIPASHALAITDDERISLDPDEGEIGEEVEVSGTDFEESYDYGGDDYKDYYVSVYFTDESVDEGDDIDDLDNYEVVDSSDWVDEDGEWDTTFDVPDELTEGDEGDAVVTGGDYYVFVTYEDDDEIVAVAEFTVIAAEIVLDPTRGPVGTEVEITGTDFTKYDYIYIDFDGDELDIESGEDEVDRYGEFTVTVLIPESTAGEHTITVTDDSDVAAEATFTVEPEISLSAATGAAGDTITVSGTGFGREVDVSVEFDGTELNSTVSDDYGSFNVGIKLPVRASGPYTVEAKDEERNKAAADFEVKAGITLNPANGNVGSQLTVSGSGFTPNASVNISYAGAQVATATADGSGKFTASFEVPKSQSGARTVTAADGANTATATFTMESVPPPVPAPQLPLMDDKAKSQAYFDWNDVTDPSGVTYSLQIATDQGFSSLVLEKTGITDSEYTLTKEEKLVSTKKDAPYYWRVQAVDGAGNESGWTTPGAFYVGFSLSFPTWALYTLIGIAGVLLLLVGFLLGRRTSYL